VTYMLMIRMKPGLTADSTKPRRNLFAAIPEKLRQAGVVMTITPHSMVVQPRNFAIGSRWSKYPAGYWATR